jgi:uncharacterized protein YndB with AHSA1/START domain
MKENFTGKSSIVINAPVYKVWNALTQPELIKKYLLGASTETDWKLEVLYVLPESTKVKNI